MKMSEIRRYGILETSVCEMQAVVADLKDRKSKSSYAGIREVYENKIEDHEGKIACGIGKMLCIDYVIIYRLQMMWTGQS